jgi:hypothetical protein
LHGLDDVFQSCDAATVRLSCAAFVEDFEVNSDALKDLYLKWRDDAELVREEKPDAAAAINKCAKELAELLFGKKKNGTVK